MIKSLINGIGSNYLLKYRKMGYFGTETIREGFVEKGGLQQPLKKKKNKKPSGLCLIETLGKELEAEELDSKFAFNDLINTLIAHMPCTLTLF